MQRDDQRLAERVRLRAPGVSRYAPSDPRRAKDPRRGRPRRLTPRRREGADACARGEGCGRSQAGASSVALAHIASVQTFTLQQACVHVALSEHVDDRRGGAVRRPDPVRRDDGRERRAVGGARDAPVAPAVGEDGACRGERPPLMRSCRFRAARTSIRRLARVGRDPALEGRRDDSRERRALPGRRVGRRTGSGCIARTP